MRITSFGCSLTWGTDLSDDNSGGTKITEHGIFPTASRSTWPARIARVLGHEYHCWAMGGAGNLCIADRVLRWAQRWPDDVLVINWTYIDRFDYSNPKGQHFDNGQQDYLTARPGESDAISEFYFRHIHSEYRDKITNLMSINLVWDLLIQNKRRFIMTCLDDTLWCQQWHAPPHVVELQDRVRSSVYDFEGKNFLDWSRYRGFRISENNHPLEEAHAAAAEIMLPRIDAILRRA